MATVTGFTYFPIEFDKRAGLSAPSKEQVRALEGELAGNRVTDLIVMSHGWNNDMQEADELYEELLRNSRALISEGKFPTMQNSRFVVLGVLWPSKKFADKDLIPSGAAGIANTVAEAGVREQLEALRGGFDAENGDDTLTELQDLLPKLEDSPKARRRFVELCRSLVDVTSASKDDEAESNAFFNLEAPEVFKRLEQPTSFVSTMPPSVETGGALGLEHGGAAGFGDFFSGVISGARNVLNYTTYYQMKERAGLIGSKGVNPILGRIRQSHPALRIHLVGHSFGGRLVTATAAGSDDTSVLKIDSMTLLQAAFSHHAFSANWDGNGKRGFFRRVVEKEAVSGPIVITYTENDKAVGVAYPIASLLAGQNASGLGDKNSPYGGIGRNGAQKIEAEDLTMVKDSPLYKFGKGRIHNLLADSCIENHGDVRNRSVAAAMLAAFAAA